MSFHARAADALAGLAPWMQTVVRLALVLVVGAAIIFVLRRYALAALARAPHVDATLRGFLGRMLSTGSWLVLFVVLLATAGVDLAALLGGLAIGGFILGFALKDTLGNLAAGVMLLFYRPFDILDVVEVSGVAGEVRSLGIALTTLRQADGRLATIPNGQVLGGTIINHTREPMRRADVVVGVGYGDDLGKVVASILDALARDPRVLPAPAPDVRVTSLGDDAVQLQVRPWVPTGDFWQAQSDFHGVVKQAVADAGGEIPFPQRVVHHA